MAGKMPDNPLAVFDLVSPNGEAFAAAIAGEDGYEVYSNRSGNWQLDNKLHAADLLHPEQSMLEWDVVVRDLTD